MQATASFTHVRLDYPIDYRQDEIRSHLSGFYDLIRQPAEPRRIGERLADLRANRKSGIGVDLRLKPLFGLGSQRYVSARSLIRSLPDGSL